MFPHAKLAIAKTRKDRDLRKSLWMSNKINLGHVSTGDEVGST